MIEEVSRNSVVKPLKEVVVLLEEFQNSFPPKLPDSMPSMLNLEHVKDFEQPLKLPNALPPMLDIQHVINFEQFAELYESLPLIHDKKDKDGLDSLECV